jgi:4'-phosphopantetheinyl transferase
VEQATGSRTSGDAFANRDADAVHVWLIGGTTPHPALERLYAVLDPGELLRADACITEAHRREFVVAHAAVRCIVGERLDVPPAQIRWAIGPHGKPELRGAGQGLQVNLSHSGGFCMVALTRSRRVGVDVQTVVADSAAVALARRYFPPQEARLVLDCDGGEGGDGGERGEGREERTELFARLWARKEAVVKAAGSRLSQGFAVPVHGPVPMTVDFRANPAPGSYRVADLEAPQGCRAAVALSGGGDFRVAQHQWRWPGTLSAHAATSPHGAAPL